MDKRMTTEVLTQAQLEAIRKRAEKATSGNRLTDMGAFEASAIVLTEDIPALLAEVERLQKVLTDMAKWPLGEYGQRENHLIRKARESIGGDTE